LIFLTLSIPAAMWIRKIEKNVNLAQGKIKKEQL
jgi:polar amino acid transport system permease protein